MFFFPPILLQPSVSGMEPPFGDAFENYSFVDQALTSTELLATSSDPDFMYELVSSCRHKHAQKQRTERVNEATIETQLTVQLLVLYRHFSSPRTCYRWWCDYANHSLSLTPNTQCHSGHTVTELHLIEGSKIKGHWSTFVIHSVYNNLLKLFILQRWGGGAHK